MLRHQKKIQWISILMVASFFSEGCTNITEILSRDLLFFTRSPQIKRDLSTVYPHFFVYLCTIMKSKIYLST